MEEDLEVDQAIVQAILDQELQGKLIQALIHISIKVLGEHIIHCMCITDPLIIIQLLATIPLYIF